MRSVFCLVMLLGWGVPVTAQPADDLHAFLDAWHRAAAEADEDVFFGSMAEDGIYLGTDASERWLRDEMAAWAKPYFENESAWAFTPHDRTFYFSEDSTYAWFEELLDTWMGTCRGSGVLHHTPALGWKIKQYNLAVAVPNDLIRDYLTLLNQAPDSTVQETVIYLVRHAEKAADDPQDPTLSDTGTARAQALAEMLKEAGLTHIHSTNFKRTLQTAHPLAEALDLTVTPYDPRDLPGFATQLKAMPGRHLVVGHSNTTPALVEALGGHPGAPIAEDEYSRLYQLTLLKAGPVVSTLLRY